jgi:putative transposase
VRRNKLALYYHLVWATWDRLPMIALDIERRLYRNIESQVREMKGTVLALNGDSMHVHLVVSLPTMIAIADLVKQVKGVSSHFVNRSVRPEREFKWQGGYAAFTVSRWNLPRVISYVNRQKEHHSADDLWYELEEIHESPEPTLCL